MTIEKINECLNLALELRAQYARQLERHETLNKVYACTTTVTDEKGTSHLIIIITTDSKIVNDSLVARFRTMHVDVECHIYDFAYYIIIQLL